MILDKAKMAHDWSMKHGKADTIYNREETVKLAWQYADAMQAEADKRVVKLPDVFFDANKNEEWQPDWSQAPSWANWWAMDGFSKKANWYIDKPHLDDDSEVESEWDIDLNTNTETYTCAPSFNYQGYWQDSLRKRPQ